VGKAQANKERRRAARDAARNLVLWHGGVSGLAAGSRLLPPTHTNDANNVADMGVPDARRDRVYFTTDVELARVFAAAVSERSGHSALYRVEPVGQMDPDPDFPEVGFQAKQALIAEVVENDVTLTKIEMLQRQRPYLTWQDGRYVYDERGRMLINPTAAEQGFAQHDFDELFGSWTPLEVAEGTLTALLMRSQFPRRMSGNRPSGGAS
jgi:hypothetical protein